MALNRGGTNNSRKLKECKTHTIVTKNCIRLTAVGFNKCLVFTNALKFHERKKKNMTNNFFSVKIRMLSALVSFLFYLCIFWRTEKPWAQTENWYLRQQYLKIIHTHTEQWVVLIAPAFTLVILLVCLPIRVVVLFVIFASATPNWAWCEWQI